MLYQLRCLVSSTLSVPLKCRLHPSCHHLVRMNRQVSGRYPYTEGKCLLPLSQSPDTPRNEEGTEGAKGFSPLVITEKLYFLHYLGSRSRFLLKVLSSFNLCHPLFTVFNAIRLLSQQVYNWNVEFFFSFLRLDAVARRNFHQKSRYWAMLSFHIFYSSVTCGIVLSGISENCSLILKRKRMDVPLGPWSWHSAMCTPH